MFLLEGCAELVSYLYIGTNISFSPKKWKYGVCDFSNRNVIMIICVAEMIKDTTIMWEPPEFLCFMLSTPLCPAVWMAARTSDG